MRELELIKYIITILLLLKSYVEPISMQAMVFSPFIFNVIKRVFAGCAKSYKNFMAFNSDANLLIGYNK